MPAIEKKTNVVVRASMTASYGKILIAVMNTTGKAMMTKATAIAITDNTRSSFMPNMPRIKPEIDSWMMQQDIIDATSGENGKLSVIDVTDKEANPRNDSPVQHKPTSPGFSPFVSSRYPAKTATTIMASCNAIIAQNGKPMSYIPMILDSTNFTISLQTLTLMIKLAHGTQRTQGYP